MGVGARSSCIDPLFYFYLSGDTVHYLRQEVDGAHKAKHLRIFDPNVRKREGSRREIRYQNSYLPLPVFCSAAPAGRAGCRWRVVARRE